VKTSNIQTPNTKIQTPMNKTVSGKVGGKNKHPMDRAIHPHENKFHLGNGEDGKHYWLTPPDLRSQLQAEFHFDFDACPFPKPEDFDGLTCEWGQSTYANIPFGTVIGPDGKKKGPTAWARKAIAENKKGKHIVMLYPIDKWILMMLAAGAKVRNLGDVKWCATEDGSPGKGTGRHIAAFILEPVHPLAHSPAHPLTPDRCPDTHTENPCTRRTTEL
jgi:hypothetical protein